MALFITGGSHEFKVKEANFNSTRGSLETIEVLRQNICIGAIHDSAERCDAPKCRPETRVAIQDEAVTWLSLGSRETHPQRMSWINGPAGAGKTAIMGSVAERCEARGLLAASFFFSAISANTRRQSKRYFIPTLAYQLSQHLDALKAPILSAVDKRPDLFEKNLVAQAERLILEPLRQVPETVDRTAWPPAIIIDGLDECRAEQYLRPEPAHGKRRHGNDQREILQALAKIAQDPIFPFRILVASRPDPAIYDFFHGEGISVANIIILNKSYAPDKDIELYLRSRFSEIRLRYNLSPNWPTYNVVPTLVKNSSGQFAYPAVIMRFIDDDENPQPPPALLDIAMRTTGSSALAPLDAMYTTILNSVPDPFLAVTWIRAIRWTQDQLFHSATNKQRRYGVLETSPGEAGKILGPLRSLIKIPSADHEEGGYSFHHNSFLDYLDDPARSGPLFVDSRSRGNDRTLRFEKFMLPRFLRVLQDPAANTVFIPLDLILVPLANHVNHIFTAEETALLACRVREWALQDLANYSFRFHSLDTLSNLFECVHISCFFNCTPVCKQWRADIQAACEANRYHLKSPWSRKSRKLLGKRVETFAMQQS